MAERKAEKGAELESKRRAAENIDVVNPREVFPGGDAHPHVDNDQITVGRYQPLLCRGISHHSPGLLCVMPPSVIVVVTVM